MLSERGKRERESERALVRECECELRFQIKGHLESI